MRIKETKILPCPFCGGEPKLNDVWKYGLYKVICTKCNASGFSSLSKSYAIKKWNKRVK